MNYIKEMNAFYDYMEFNPLSSSAVALWFALMHINNKTRWKEEFTVAGTVLRYKSGLKETSFKRARKELVDKGYIIYQSRERNLAPIYRMVSLTEKWEAGGDKESFVKDVDQEEFSQDTQEAMASTTEESQNQEKHLPQFDSVTFYEKNIGKLSSYEKNTLLTWVQDCGQELVFEAVKLAVKRNKKSFRYVRGILIDWQKKGIRTVVDVEKEQLAFQRRLGQHNFSWHKGTWSREEVVPDWFKELKEKEQRERREKRKERDTIPEKAGKLQVDLEEWKKRLVTRNL